METPNRRSILKATASVGIIGGLAGCADEDDDEPPAEDEPEDETTEGETDEPDEELAGVRAAHLSPDAPNVDIYVDDEPVIEDVGFGDVSDYLELEAGEYDVRITEAGEEEAVFEESLEVEAADYTLAAIGELADENQAFDLAVFEDDLTDPGEEARVRLIHAAPDAPAVDVAAADADETLFEELAFGDAQTVAVPAGDYSLDVVPADADEDDEPVETFELTVEAETVYTGFAVGYLEPDDAPADEPFDLVVVQDAPDEDAPDEDEEDAAEDEHDDPDEEETDDGDEHTDDEDPGDDEHNEDGEDGDDEDDYET